MAEDMIPNRIQKILTLRLNPQIKDNVWNWTLRYTNTSGTGYLDYISLKYPKIFNASQENPCIYCQTRRIPVIRYQSRTLRQTIKSGGKMG
jgi:hypothetical protein